MFQRGTQTAVEHACMHACMPAGRLPTARGLLGACLVGSAVSKERCRHALPSCLPGRCPVAWRADTLHCVRACMAVPQEALHGSVASVLARHCPVPLVLLQPPEL